VNSAPFFVPYQDLSTMTEITRVPLQPLAKGSLAKVWLGVVAAVALAAGIAWAAMPPGVSVDTTTAGTGPHPGAEDVVFVKYTGKLEDGITFDESPAQIWPIPGIMPDGVPMALPDGVIPGMAEALLQTQKGGKYTIEIPAKLGYGATPPPGAPIPPNADLTFEIEVVDFMPRPQAEQRYMQMMQMAQAAQGEAGAPGAPPAGGGAPAAPAQAPAPASAPSAPTPQ